MVGSQKLALSCAIRAQTVSQLCKGHRRRNSTVLGCTVQKTQLKHKLRWCAPLCDSLSEPGLSERARVLPVPSPRPPLLGKGWHRPVPQGAGPHRPHRESGATTRARAQNHPKCQQELSSLDSGFINPSQMHTPGLKAAKRNAVHTPPGPDCGSGTEELQRQGVSIKIHAASESRA